MTRPPMKPLSTTGHVRHIEAWVLDAVRDNPGVSEDEIYSDMVHAYLDSEIGSSTPAERQLRADILRATGVGERR